MRRLINANTVKTQNCKWVTLTYAENMTDSARLYIDIKNFIKRLRYYFGECEYIIVAEPQERGAWHGHLILIYPAKAPFIPNERMAKIWSHGFTVTRKIRKNSNLGLYLTTYLTDIEVTKGKAVSDDLTVVRKSITDEHGKKESKRFIKGGRLHFYPAGFHFYRTSRNIARPFTERMCEARAQEYLKDFKLTYESTHLIFDDTVITDGYENIVNVRYYVRVRKRRSTPINAPKAKCAVPQRGFAIKETAPAEEKSL